jgi:hypothetical protein
MWCFKCKESGHIFCREGECECPCRGKHRHRH